MRWQGGRESENVEDARGVSPQAMMVGGGIGTIVIVILGLLFGADPAQLMRLVQQANVQRPAEPGQGQERELSPEEIQIGKFVSTVLADTEDDWTEIFAQEGKQYIPPKLKLFSGSVQTACGGGSAAMGPFYCPADRKVYLDTEFFKDLKDKFGADDGDFARAYVIAHEVGHHVQNLLGRTRMVDSQRANNSEEEQNRLSVRLELQADFYAGVWANHANKRRKILEAGDVEAALSAAKAIGDDTLEKRARGYAVPDSFTHGTSAQRIYWLKKGLQSGNVRDGDTFKPGAVIDGGDH